MQKLMTAFAAIALASSGATFAQTTVSKAEAAVDGKMAVGQTKDSTKMTAAEKKQWKACMGMSDSQMANAPKCMELKERGAGVANEGVTSDGLPKGK